MSILHSSCMVLPLLFSYLTFTSFYIKSLEAVRCDPNEQSRDHLPYCLSMLTIDGSSVGNLCRTFEYVQYLFLLFYVLFLSNNPTHHLVPL